MGIFDRWRKRDEIVNLNERSPKTGVAYGDLAIVGQLIKAGADITQPRHVIHYLYFGSESSAQAAAIEAATRSFAAQVREPLPDYPDQWGLVCEQEAGVLSIEALRDNRDFFEALATGHAGEYDGWEASV